MSYRPSITNKLNVEANTGKTTISTTKVTSVPVQASIESGLTLTGVSIVSGRFRLSSGASYYIEASTATIALDFTARPPNAVYEVALYNHTTSTEIGQRMIVRLPGTAPLSLDRSPRCTRWCARALILASDFGVYSTMDIELRVVACSPTNIWWISGEGTPQEGTSQVSIVRIP
jgi:hypothetical protein